MQVALVESNAQDVVQTTMGPVSRVYLVSVSERSGVVAHHFRFLLYFGNLFFFLFRFHLQEGS